MAGVKDKMSRQNVRGLKKSYHSQQAVKQARDLELKIVHHFKLPLFGYVDAVLVPP